MANKAIKYENEMVGDHEDCLKHERSNFLTGSSLTYSIPCAKIMTRPGSRIMSSEI